MNILITGASGVLAKNIIKKLSENINFQIYASSRHIENLNQINNVKYLNNDKLLNTNILSEIDLILNCAFPRNNKPNVLTEILDFYSSLVTKALELKVKNIINISSQDVYGTYREKHSTENDKINPENNYALTKYACEIIGSTMVKNTATKLTNIRLASLIGIDYPQRVINKIIKKAIETHSISINNDKNIFGYMDIEDATNGLIAFIQNSDFSNWQNIYNFGQKYDEQKDFKYIANTIKQYFEENNTSIQFKIKITSKAEKLCFLDSDQFYSIANFQPEFSLKQSIEKIFMSITGKML